MSDAKADVLETERLRVRPLTLADAPFILELLNQPSFVKNIGDRGVRDIETAESYLRKGPFEGYKIPGFGLKMVEDKSTGTPLGICGLLQRIYLPDPDIGFAFLEKFQRLGYGTEAASAVLVQARDELRFPRVVGITTIENVGSAKVLEKIGMQYEKMIFTEPDKEELKLFSIDLHLKSRVE